MEVNTGKIFSCAEEYLMPGEQCISLPGVSFGVHFK